MSLVFLFLGLLIPIGIFLYITGQQKIHTRINLHIFSLTLFNIISELQNNHNNNIDAIDNVVIIRSLIKSKL